MTCYTWKWDSSQFWRCESFILPKSCFSNTSFRKRIFPSVVSVRLRHPFVLR